MIHGIHIIPIRPKLPGGFQDIRGVFLKQQVGLGDICSQFGPIEHGVGIHKVNPPSYQHGLIGGRPIRPLELDGLHFLVLGSVLVHGV